MFNNSVDVSKPKGHKRWHLALTMTPNGTCVGWSDLRAAWRDKLSTVGPYPVEAFHSQPLDKGEPSMPAPED